MSYRQQKDVIGRITPALTTLNMAAFAPIPRARVIAATIVNPGFRRSSRIPKRTMHYLSNSGRPDSFLDLFHAPKSHQRLASSIDAGDT